MSKRIVLASILVGAWAFTACGGDDGGPTGGSGGAGGAGAGGAGAGGAGAGGMGGGGRLNTDEPVNLDCPGPGPHEGDGAPRGACCHRASNIYRETLLGPDEGGALEYRIQTTLTTNHPLTLGEMTLETVALQRSDNEEQDLLWSFGGPRMDDKEIAGPGYTKIGSGRYNCDGTYSYFSDTAAPMRGIPGRDDPARWAARKVDGMVDPTKFGRDHLTTTFASQTGQRELAYAPFLNSADLSLGFELATQGFDIDEISTEGAGRDCIGSREGATWKAGGSFHLYTPLEPNNHEGITLLSGEKYCQLIAFGIGPADMLPDCLGDRCEPGTADCLWKKLPDSLCPVTTEEKALWGCHVGYEGNPDKDPTNCTAEKPTTIQDPLTGGSAGQCCDPLAKSTTLPACNAYILHQSYVAAAAKITEKPADKLFEKCAD